MKENLRMYAQMGYKDTGFSPLPCPASRRNGAQAMSSAVGQRKLGV